MHRNMLESHGHHDSEIDSARAAAGQDAVKCSEDIVHDLDSKFSVTVVCLLIFLLISSLLLP